MRCRGSVGEKGKLHIGLIAFCMLLLWCSDSFAAKKQRKILSPVAGQKATVVTHSNLEFYKLESDVSTVLHMKGPAKFRVLTLPVFHPGDDLMKKYAIAYRLNGGKEEVTFAKSKRSDDSFVNDTLGVPGEIKGFTLELARGEHTVELKSAHTGETIFARYYLYPKKNKKISWISLQPTQSIQPVDLLLNETEFHYYRFSRDVPLTFTAIGPTTVRVLTRVENHYTMKGRINYRLQVKNKDKVINTYRLSSKPSESAEYKEHTQLLPGKAKEITLQIPKGQHTYSISPPGDDDRQFIGRLLLPEKDIVIEKSTAVFKSTYLKNLGWNL